MSIDQIAETEKEPNPKLLELQERAREMAKYYFKGFGDTLNDILNNTSFYLRHPELDNQKKMQEAYEGCKEIEDFYKRIQFEFKPLLNVRELLPAFRHALETTFQTKSYEDFNRLNQIRHQIVENAETYFNSLIQLLHEIRAFPEAKDFRVAIPDQNKDYIWHF